MHHKFFDIIGLKGAHYLDADKGNDHLEGWSARWRSTLSNGRLENIKLT